MRSAAEQAVEALEKSKNVIGNVVKEFQGLKSQFKSEDEECKCVYILDEV